MRRAIYPRPVIPLLLALIAGITGGAWFPGYALLFFWAGVLPTGFLLFALIKRQGSEICPLFLVLILGYLSLQPWMAPRFPPDHVIHFTGTRLWEIIGTIETPPLETHGRLRFVFRADSLRDAKTGETHPVVGKIRVTISSISTPGDGHEDSMQLALEDRLSIGGKIKRPRNFSNPGGFNYERFMAFQEIWATTFVPMGRVNVLSQAENSPRVHPIETVRLAIAKRINASAPMGARLAEKATLRALVVGDRAGITRDLRDAFNRAGIGHLLAISGLHVGIVATVAFSLFHWMLSFSGALLRKAGTRKGAAILSFFPVLFYGLLAGMSPSTQRAVIMVTLFLMTFIFEREQDLVNTLALAAMVILVIHPPALFSVSFLLSFGAVFAILFGLSRIPDRWTKGGGDAGRLYRVWARGRLFMLVSLFAILGTLPLVMYFFNQVSLIGLLVNCLMVPLIGFLVVPLGLLSVLLLIVWPSGAALLIQGNLLVLQVGIGITKWLADLPFSALKTVTPSFLEIGCYYVLAWAVLSLTSVKSELPAGKVDPKTVTYSAPATGRKPLFRGIIQGFRWRIVPWFSGSHLARSILILALITLSIDVGYWVNQRFLTRKLKITTFDVGQGTGSLLELPRGHCVLLDGGGFSDNTIFDVGERIIAPVLWRRKIKTVDTLILTHPNSDHLNGLLYIADQFNVKTIWTNDDTSRTKGYGKLVSIIKSRQISKPRFRDLARSQKINGVTFSILSPPLDHLSRSRKESWRNSNNNSLVIRVTLDQFSALFPGDIEIPAERELVSIHGDNLKSMVLMAPHHGSKTSSSASFLGKVNPEYVIISAGWRNHFGFPNGSVLERYRRLGSRILSTADHGAIEMVTDGRQLSIDTMISPLGSARPL